MKRFAAFDSSVGIGSLVHLCKSIEETPGIPIFEFRMPWLPPLPKNVRDLAGSDRLAINRPDDQVVGGRVRNRLGPVGGEVTSGRIEGFNSQISMIVHRACGIANLDYLFLRLRHQSVMRI